MGSFCWGAYLSRLCLLGITTVAVRTIAVVICVRGVTVRSTGRGHETSGRNHHRQKTEPRSQQLDDLREAIERLNERIDELEKD